MMQFIVHKLNHLGEEKIAWPGRVLARTDNAIVLEATFTHGPLDLGYVVLKPGDRFIEHYFFDRWYNIFEIYDVDDGAFKGWYCNVTRPARLEADDLSAEDLALDVFARPGGAALALDEDEFAALPLAEEDARQARAALRELLRLAAEGALPHTLED